MRNTESICDRPRDTIFEYVVLDQVFAICKSARASSSLTQFPGANSTHTYSCRRSPPLLMLLLCYGNSKRKQRRHSLHGRSLPASTKIHKSVAAGWFQHFQKFKWKEVFRR